jgi:hypothetical protein
MNCDFMVGQSNELIKGSRIYDLHNCFDFDGLDVSKAGELRLTFKPNAIHGKGYSSVFVFAQDIDRLAVSPDFGSMTVKDLEEIGYKSSGDEDDNWLLVQNQATSSDDLFFRFNGGHYVRFHCRCASLIEAPTASDSPPS